MPDNPITRRLITVPAVVVLFVTVTALSPVLLVVGASVDLVRASVAHRPWITLRILGFLWVYLLGELWALVALGLTAPLPAAIKLPITYRLQGAWAGWNLSALQTLFSMTIDVEGSDSVHPGPIIVLSRHASLVDTLLPARLVSGPSGLRLRYVLKKELLADPALDIAGNRLPNVFVDRASGEVKERTSIRELGTDLGPDDGVLIYPEGTRFSEAKLRRHLRKPATGGDPSGLRRVLPPKPGGTLALLEVAAGDIVVLAHRGLEGLATVREIWSGDLVGSTIDVFMWRIPRAELPDSRSGRVDWLANVWGEIDDWVVSRDPGTDTPDP